MKRFYLVVLGGLLSVITSQGANTADDGYAGFASSQNYHWTYVDQNGQEIAGFFSGLTTIDDQEYAVFKSDAPSDFFPSESEGYIRQSDGKVFTYIYENTSPGEERVGSEYLLWDFNLEPGDVFEGFEEFQTSPQKVMEKWTVDIDGPKRVLRLHNESSSYFYTVVEGLGAMEYGTMAASGYIDWKTSASSTNADLYLLLSSVSDGNGSTIYERGSTLVSYTPIISEDRVWEYGVGEGKSMSVERMAFRGTRTMNGREYHCFGTLYLGPRVPVEGIEAVVAFNPYLLREEFGKVYLLHTPGSYRVEEDATMSPVESLLYDFTVADGCSLSVFAGGDMTEGSVAIADPIIYRDIECKNYTLWTDGPVFMECLGALGGGNLAEFGKECSAETQSLRYVYSDKGDLLYSVPGLPAFSTKTNTWNYRSYLPGRYVNFEMLFAWQPVEIDGRNYYSFYTDINNLYDNSGSKPVLESSVRSANENRFLIRQESGRILMRVPEQRVWPFLNMDEGVREVCLYDFELEEGDTYEMFTTSGPMTATLIGTSTETVFNEERLLQTFRVNDEKTIEVVEGLGNVTRGTYVTIDIDGNPGNQAGIAPTDMKNPAEGYPTFLINARSFEGKIYSNEDRFLSSVDSFVADEDRFVVPSRRIFDLMGRELSEPIPGHPFIKGGKIFMEK